MNEVKIVTHSAAFDNLPLSEKAFNQIAGKAKILNLYSSPENRGFGIYLYNRTILTPSSSTVQQDGVVFSFTPPESAYTRGCIIDNYLSSSGLPVDILNEAVTNNANHPSAIIDGRGFIHLLELRKSRGEGYLWYLLNSGRQFRAA